MSTYSPSRRHHAVLHVIDADDVVLGRLAVTAATLLRGKHKPTYAPHVDGGDFVVVVNASKIALTGKRTDKPGTGTGRPGGLRSVPYGELLDRDPRRAVELAVWGMLPKNKLSRKLIKKLKVYAGPSTCIAPSSPSLPDDPDRPVARTSESKELRSDQHRHRDDRGRDHSVRGQRPARLPTVPRRRRTSHGPAGRPAVVAPSGATGRRKEAVARVRIVPGSGQWSINGRNLEDYFPNKVHQQIVAEPFAAAAVAGCTTSSPGPRRWCHWSGRCFAASAWPRTQRRGRRSQPPLAEKGRDVDPDARIKERKKAGLKKARKAPQYSKR